MALVTRRDSQTPVRYARDPFALARELFGWDGFTADRAAATYVPAFEVKEREDAFVLRADLPGVKEAMEKSLAQGSQTFEEDIARLILEGVVTREDGIAHADSATNLMWRLDQGEAPAPQAAPAPAEDDAVFTAVTLDVHPQEKAAAAPWLVRR